MDGTIDGLRPGQEHGLAVHESGDLSGGCASVGAHFNPRGARHGSPVKGGGGGACAERHVGDLGNVRADGDGRATFRFADDLLKVWDVVGRSLVVAEGRDDLGQGGHPRSKVTETIVSFLYLFYGEKNHLADRRQLRRPALLRHHRPLRRALPEQRQEVLRLRRRHHLGREERPRGGRGEESGSRGLLTEIKNVHKRRENDAYLTVIIQVILFQQCALQ